MRVYIRSDYNQENPALIDGLIGTVYVPLGTAAKRQTLLIHVVNSARECSGGNT